jgi:hypothetical protein
MVILRDPVAGDKHTIRCWRHTPDVAAEMLTGGPVTRDEHEVILYGRQHVGLVHHED